MKATETSLIKFLQGPKQFIIPIYQRTYSWTEKQCEQFWNDIVQVAKNENIPVHFIGSIVYIEKGLYQVSNIPHLLIIDGQQRLTTLTILLAAFVEVLEKKENNITIKPNQIKNYLFFNNDESGENRYKLILTQSDKDTLINLLDGRDIQNNHAKTIINNFNYFKNQIAKNEINLELLYQGIQKLLIVDISLDSDHDRPQLIFESLNSTGLGLSQADLIRNYILMGMEQNRQNDIYKNFWYPIEEDFRRSEKGSEYFDKFMRNYLIIQSGQIPNIKDVYSSFKKHVISTSESIDDLVSDIHYYSKFFIKLIFEEEEDPYLNQIIHNINNLEVDVAYPFLLKMYVDYDKKYITKKEIIEIFSIVESYVFRRSICEIPTNILNKTFVKLTNNIKKENYFENVKTSFRLTGNYNRFPTNEEFRSQLILRDVYNTKKIGKYMLDKLENHERKERVNINEYTIEHIMPQNTVLSKEWKDDLGDNWKETHDKYLHTIGNLTLTGYNSKLSDRSFLEKSNMKGGFRNSPIRLNMELAKLTHWNEGEIIKRANIIADNAIQIWKYPQVSQEILEQYDQLQNKTENNNEYENDYDKNQSQIEINHENTNNSNDNFMNLRCPHCDKVYESIESFGLRNVGGKSVRQSWCLVCRNLKE